VRHNLVMLLLIRWPDVFHFTKRVMNKTNEPPLHVSLPLPLLRKTRGVTETRFSMPFSTNNMKRDSLMYKVKWINMSAYLNLWIIETYATLIIFTGSQTTKSVHTLTLIVDIDGITMLQILIFTYWYFTQVYDIYYQSSKIIVWTADLSIQVPLFWDYSI
jgi:hypothetical protein